MIGDRADAPIVVFGAPRSGTTYLVHLLNKHPDVFISTETRVFVWAHRALNSLTQEFYAVFQQRERFVGHLRRTLPDLIRGFYRELAPEAVLWGDKNPHYASPGDAGCLETIDALFPGAKFLHIVRDGRAAVSSVMRKGWEDFRTAHDWWTGYLDVGMSFGATLPKERYFEFRYEDLIADDLAMAKELFGFLQVDLHDDVAEYCRGQSRSRIPINRPTTDLGAPRQIGDWDRVLDPDLRLRSLDLIGPHLLRLGYETPSSLEALRRRTAAEAAEMRSDPIRGAVRATLPERCTVLVASGGDERLALSLDGRRGWHFPQVGDNVPSEIPPDGDAVAHLGELRDRGAGFLLVPRAADDAFDALQGLRAHLDSCHRVIWSDGDCVIFELADSAEDR